MKTIPFSSHNHPEPCAPRILALSLLAVLPLLALTGCKPATPATADINPAGDYTLVSVDGQSLPCRLTHEGVSPTIKSGVFSITADGHCRSLINFSVPAHGDMSREVTATYTRTGSELTMQWEGAGMTKGQLNGNQFTMNNEGMIFAYRK